jgi:hypothetical protein
VVGKTSNQPEVNRSSLENLSSMSSATVLRGDLMVRRMLRVKDVGICVKGVVEKTSNQPEVNQSSLENLSLMLSATMLRGDLTVTVTVTKGLRT